MDDDFELLSLQSPVGKGQENNPDDIEAIDVARLRKINAYSPPPEYADNPQRYATEPMIGALERYQERNGLKIDGVANPGGPTERAINNHLLEKPRGAGLLYDPPSALAGTVGNGFENRREDVASVQRRLGALNYLPEDPFDKPHGFIDESTTNGIKEFQRAKGLVDDGWLAPSGETERALEDAVADLARAKGRDWFDFVDRAARTQSSFETTLKQGEYRESPDRRLDEPLKYRPEPESDLEIILVQGRGLPATAPPTRPLPIAPFPSEGTDEVPGSPSATARFLLERILRGPSKFYLLPRHDREGDKNSGRRMENIHPSAPREEARFVPYVTESFQNNADGIVVEHRGGKDVQDYDAELARRTMLQAQSIATATQCKIIHEAGARAVKDTPDARSGRTIKKGEDIAQQKVPPRDASGKVLDKQRFGHSFPDIAFLAEPTGRRLYINSYTPDASGRPDSWERFSSLRLQRNAETGDIILLVPKLGPGEVLDVAKFNAIVFPLLIEICFPFRQGPGEPRVPTHVEPDVKRPRP